MSKNALVKQFREMLDRLARAECIGADEYEHVWDEVVRVLKNIPHEDSVLEALDKAVGSSKKKWEQSFIMISEFADVPAFRERLICSLNDPDYQVRSLLIQSIGSHKLAVCAPLLNDIMENDPHEYCRGFAIQAARDMLLEVNLPILIRIAKRMIDYPGSETWPVLVALSDYADERGAFYLEYHYDAGKDLDESSVVEIRDKSLIKTKKENAVIAAWGLYRIFKKKEYAEFLIRMLDDESIHHEYGCIPGVKRRTAQALCDILGLSSDDDIDEDIRKIKQKIREGAFHGLPD